MALVTIVIALALGEYTFFAVLVGRARGLYGVDAPAVTGHPIFERYHRVQQNTLELLILFIPGMVMFAHYVRADIAAAIGVIFVVGRALYARAYIKEPKSRSIGFGLSMLSALVLVIGGMIGAIMELM